MKNYNKQKDIDSKNTCEDEAATIAGFDIGFAAIAASETGVRMSHSTLSLISSKMKYGRCGDYVSNIRDEDNFSELSVKGISVFLGVKVVRFNFCYKSDYFSFFIT